MSTTRIERICGIARPQEPQDRQLVIPPKPAPAPQQDRWTPAGKGIERNQDGKLRTNVPLPKVGA